MHEFPQFSEKNQPRERDPSPFINFKLCSKRERRKMQKKSFFIWGDDPEIPWRMALFLSQRSADKITKETVPYLKNVPFLAHTAKPLIIFAHTHKDFPNILFFSSEGDKRFDFFLSHFFMNTRNFSFASLADSCVILMFRAGGMRLHLPFVTCTFFLFEGQSQASLTHNTTSFHL